MNQVQMFILKGADKNFFQLNDNFLLYTIFKVRKADKLTT